MTREEYEQIKNNDAAINGNWDKLGKPIDYFGKARAEGDADLGIAPQTSVQGNQNQDTTQVQSQTQDQSQGANVGPVAPDWKSDAPTKMNPIQKHDVSGNVVEGGDYRNNVVQSGPRTGTTLYFGNSGAMPEVVNAAGSSAEAQRPIGTVEGDAIDSLQIQGWANRKQNAYKNDAIVTGALVSLYNTWKGDSADGTGRVRTGLEADAVRAVNAQLQGANAGYRVTGMSCIGEKDGEPVFRVFTIDRNGKKSMHIRTAQEVYNTRLSALSNGNVQQIDAKGTPGAIEGNLIKSFGDFNGVQRRYETINRDQIEKERANLARERAAQKQIEEARRSEIEKNRLAAMELVARYEKDNGGKKMTEGEYLRSILLNPKLREKYETELEYERDGDGNIKVDPKTNIPVPKMTTDMNGETVQARRNLSKDEVYNRVKAEYKAIFGEGEANGTNSAESVFESMIRSEYPEMFSNGGVNNPQTPPPSGGTGGAVTNPSLVSGNSLAERAAKALEARKANAGNAEGTPKQVNQNDGAKTDVQTSTQKTGVISPLGPRAEARLVGPVSPRKGGDDIYFEPTTDEERKEAIDALGISDGSVNVTPSIVGGISFGGGNLPSDEKERKIREFVIKRRKEKIESENKRRREDYEKKSGKKQ